MPLIYVVTINWTSRKTYKTGEINSVESTRLTRTLRHTEIYFERACADVKEETAFFFHCRLYSSSTLTYIMPESKFLLIYARLVWKLSYERKLKLRV